MGKLLLNNLKYVAIFIGLSSLFVFYWLIKPDDGTQQAIRFMLYGWAGLVAAVTVGTFIQWKFKK